MFRLTQNEALSSRHTFGVNAFARQLIETDEPAELFRFFKDYPELLTTSLVIGEGSNLLFTQDFPGVIVHPSDQSIDLIKQGDDTVVVECGAAVNWDQLVEWTVEQGFGGLENLSGIPGSAGAAPVQNIGAYGAEAGDVISEVIVGDMRTGKQRILQASECRFAYRDSLFKKPENRHLVVWKVRFTLARKPVINLSYKTLHEALKNENHPDLQAVRKAVLDIRSARLPDPKVTGNAGSFFKNPVIPIERAEELATYYQDIPIYPLDKKGMVKVAAAWLIEQCGLKGYRHKTAAVYDKQALVLINPGNAQGKDIRELALLIQERVLSKFQIELEPEVRIL